MSKIICDVCGTMYPETAEQCPICGCAKQDNPEAVASEAVQEESSTSTYTYVKGGRFSKANVRKRNKANKKAEKIVREQIQEQEQEDNTPVEENDVVVEPGKNSNRGLMITAMVLLLAIVAVVIYIAVRFFAPVGSDPKKETDPAETTQNTTAVAETTTVATEADIACTRLQLADTQVELNMEGQIWLLNVMPVPENTTDEINYVSSDDAVVTVNAEGRLTAVAPGEATITVTCGNATAQCVVVCVFDDTPSEETTEPTTSETTDETTAETTAPVADPNAEYTVLFYGDWREDNDITLATGEGVEVTLEDDEGNVADVKWTAEDPDIVTIDGTWFEGNTPGVTNITATYGNTTYTIIVRVW